MTNERKIIHVDLNEPHIWICARGDQDTPDQRWEILGLYTKKERAVARCELPGDSVFAIPLDVDLPNETSSVDTEEWPLAEETTDGP